MNEEGFIDSRMHASGFRTCGIGSSGQHLADNAGSGNWLDGQRFGAGTPESDIQAWIEGIQ